MKPSKKHYSIGKRPSNQDRRCAKGIHNYKLQSNGTLKCIHCNYIGKNNSKSADKGTFNTVKSITKKA